MRSLFRYVLAGGLCLAGALAAYGPSYAQSDTQSDGSDAESAPPAEPQAPVGPNLQASDNAPVICDPGSAGFRYVEVRGSGFDAWATQHLVGNVVDGNGLSRMQWGSVWVSPQGSLTLEVNLCADPFRNRPALPAGNYTVTVGPGSGRALAATSIALSPPPEPPAADDQTPPETMPPAAAANPTPAPTAIAYVLPNISAAPTPTPLPVVTLANGTTSTGAPTATGGPQVGPGSRQTPFPLGASGTLVDGWQLVVTA